jgi:hypothetical protein
VELPFPALERLDAFLRGLRTAKPFVIVFPPIFVTEIPPTGTPESARLAACKAALSRLARAHPGAHLLDFHVDDDIARDPRNFMDAGHYRAPVARTVEARIAAAVTSGTGMGEQSGPAAALLDR